MLIHVKKWKVSLTAVLRGSAARWRISIPMCDHDTGCNRTCTYSPGWPSLSGCIGLHLFLYIIHRTAIDRWLVMSHSNTPPVQICISRKHLPRINLSWSTRQDFLKIPSLWEAALETKRRFFSNIILESNVTPNITSALYDKVIRLLQYCSANS